MRKLLLVIFLLLSHTLQSFSPEYRHEERKQNIILSIEKSKPLPKKITTILAPDSLYTKVLGSIKKFEGLRLTSYMCPANQKTIGYGHCIKSTDNIGDTITLAEAEQLLMEDFNNCVVFVKSQIKGLSIENDTHKVLALAHFVFNVGSGNFVNSSILSKLKNNEPIDEELLKWVHYRDKDDNLVHSDYLKQIRQYEVDLFNGVA